VEVESPPTPFELKLKELYEYAQTYKNQEMLTALGFITTDYISDKNALPLSVYRLRQIVAECKSHSSRQIEALEKQFADHLGGKISAKASQYLNKQRLIKFASVRKPPVFRRVSQ
jgi:hypothetical protein